MDTTGIYALFWPSSGMVYIGQSQTIDKRFKEHLRTLTKKSHANPKMQYQYEKYGNPELVILEICGVDELYEKEVFWTKEFDSLYSGLNIVEPGPSGWGVHSSQSKYSKIQVLKVFSLLTKTNLANIDISKKLNVSLKLVESIRNGYSHTWLKMAYPDSYAKLSNKTKVKNTTARRLGRKVILLNVKTGQYYEIDSVVDFAKNICNDTSTKFASGIRRVIRKEQKYFKDWVLEESKDTINLASVQLAAGL